MAEEKVARWSLRAIFDKIEILDYWIQRNKSTKYSDKLDVLFDQAIELVARFPESGKKTDYRNVRIKIVRHYLVYYRIKKDGIEVVRIMDPRKGEDFTPE